MVYTLNSDLYALPKVYKRNGLDCFFDPIRQKLILITPEEIVRQKTINFLITEMNVPADMIEVEVPMSYFIKGARGRADIIVYGAVENELCPVLIIECKAKGIPLTDKVFNQVYNYDNQIYANVVMVTNGEELFIEVYDEDNKRYYPTTKIPDYKDLLSNSKLEPDKNNHIQWKRPSFDTIFTKEVEDLFCDYGWIGEDTIDTIKPFLINLIGFIQDDSKKVKPNTIEKINLSEDGGIRYTTFGNAAGGNWTGDYRYFILQDNNRNHQIVSITIAGSQKHVNDKVFGSRKGETFLIVAIDDFDKSHNSLQLNLDKYLRENGEVYSLCHDGKLTNGKKGSVKKALVIDFIKEKEPDLIIDQEVFLGEFHNDKEINWYQKTTREFIGRLIKYALLRDELRSLLNEEYNQ
jgi:hypothetical protein